MSFVAEMIVPQEGLDDLGQKAEATSTFLQYSVTIAYRKDDDGLNSWLTRTKKEELVRILHERRTKKVALFSIRRNGATQWSKRKRRARRLSYRQKVMGAIESSNCIRMVRGTSIKRSAVEPSHALCFPLQLRQKVRRLCWRGGKCNLGDCFNWNHRHCGNPMVSGRPPSSAWTGRTLPPPFTTWHGGIARRMSSALRNSKPEVRKMGHRFTGR